MRVGVLGVGRIGALHAASLAADPRVGAVAVLDPDARRAGEVVRPLGARVLLDRDDLAAWRPDAVVLATPTDTHAALILEWARAGLPVFCEKPCFTDLDTARAVVAEVGDAGSVVHVGFQRRFDPGYRRAYNAVRTGELGELRRAHLVTADPAPPPAEYVARSGGIHRDCQIHDYDVLRWVTGREVVEVYATGANRGDPHFAAVGDVDEAAVLLTLDDGTLVTAQASRYNGAGYDVRMEVAGTEGTLAVGWDERVPVRSAEPSAPPPGDAWSGFLPRFATAYQAEMTAFVTLVAEGGTSPCEVSDALRALEIAEAVTRSRRDRRPVSLPALTAPAVGA
ncbi:Gfo/Idh/MocA family oxidoreductase [Actinokineospora auranticolor]|uniref:Myo-inositol 2-dehydrogenase/D-chiro-inositol 1-dehydrogenase n=1 Tax=Actinokineospora auranticolor TaxID=155976 RepID=A0A2S6GIE8_9PSEU|nr:Gfo/Idh/MocA family oxidoreductase [Actinokineospora auranticolor]PPK65004.1 myo-inositol 2-dehydrogenase/D-chiro-inositol 1-dehydrogenase [Actinokineospora auranticolor]